VLVNKQYFNEMSLPNKVKYLIHYYGLAVIGVVVLIFFIIYLVKPIFENKKYDAYCLILNDTENNELVERIQNGFPKYLNDSKYSIGVDNSYPFFYLEEEGINWPGEGIIYKFLNLSGTHKADVMISDYNTMLWAVYQEFIYSIDQILPAELLEKLEPYFVYAYFKDYDESDGKIYGLNISETKVYKGYSGNYENAIILIPNVTKQPEMVINFIKYLFELINE
jgi:hypothetical protein